MKLHCCIDLELEQPKTNPQTPDSLLDEMKIIQVGYVIYSLEPEFEVVKSVREYIKIGVPLSAFIKSLTGIKDEDLESKGITLQESYDTLKDNQKTHKFSRIVKQWGCGDMEYLREELGGDDWAFGRSGCNIKHLYQMYAEANGINSSGGLSKSMTKCGLIWKGRGKHDALLDALNTARFHHFLYKQLKK